MYSPDLEQRFERLATQYPVKRSALIPMLLYAQDEIGYISDEVVVDVARRLDLTPLDVRNVISYYSLMRTKPVGKFHIQVCTNISCMLRGAEELFAHCENRLGIGHKETAPDGVFSLEEVECIGGCSWAPAIQINYDYHLDVDSPDKMNAILDEYRRKAQQ
ncbi:MAG TPA: NAD(P)H-dependent oxidoreductase subunit E [Terriglobales bacterium]|jgi:NADH-quinone oxidoreductase subunit E